jgi:hypothetical protein
MDANDVAQAVETGDAQLSDDGGAIVTSTGAVLATLVWTGSDGLPCYWAGELAEPPPDFATYPWNHVSIGDRVCGLNQVSA